MRNKIGTITFHWATNYGAVLQAFALQQFLIKQGYDTEIIDYRPYRVMLLQRLNGILKRDVETFRKEKKLKDFRNKELKRSRKIYKKQEALEKGFGNYDVLITGSDQIWNQSFTLGAEGKPTLSYFLQGANEDCKRIAYAVSFGTEHISDRYKQITKKEILKFNAISVRENSGLDILQKYGVKGTLVCDPSLLLERTDYERLLLNQEYKSSEVFSYILHHDAIAMQVAVKVNAIWGYDQFSPCSFQKGMYEWLYQIKHAGVVVTNSFHGVMMSLIFNTPFIVVLIKGSGMNDRLYTILRELNLEDRIIDTFDEVKIERLCKEEIQWSSANEKMQILKDISREFLLKQIEA